MVDAAKQALVDQIDKLGNPSSLHMFGRATRKDVEESREAIARAIESRPSEVIFTASGTEANNIALKGLHWLHANHERKVLVISAIEHHAILDPAHWLGEAEGAEVIEIPVLPSGVIDLAFLQNLVEARGKEITAISVMHANNETGTIQPISEIVKIASESQIPVHCDAVQSFGKVPLSFKNLGVTAMTLSAHKIGGPLGIGALVLQQGLEIPSLIHGGGQEREIRSGTLNAPSITAFAAAATDSLSKLEERGRYLRQLREQFIAGAKTAIPDLIVNGSGEQLPGIVNLTFPGTESDTLLLLFDAAGVACSTGSACSAGVHEPSHVLMAMGHSQVSAQSSLRFSLSYRNTESEIAHVISLFPEVIAKAGRQTYESYSRNERWC